MGTTPLGSRDAVAERARRARQLAAERTSRSDEPRDMSRQPPKSDVDELITRDLFELLHARLREPHTGR